MPRIASTHEILKRLNINYDKEITASQEAVLKQLHQLLKTLEEKLEYASGLSEGNEKTGLKEIISLIDASWQVHYDLQSQAGLDGFCKILYEGLHQQINLLKQNCVKRLKELIPANELEEIAKEEQNITNGLYQHQYYTFTYDEAESIKSSYGSYYDNTVINTHNRIKSIDKQSKNLTEYELCPVLDKPGLVCTAATPLLVLEDEPLEIQLNFFGTIDFASQKVDMEDGGPGQETIKQYENELIKQVNTLVEQLAEKFPERPIRLRISGHSLGGSLAKAFTYSLQKAIALQHHEPDEIRREIEKNISEQLLNGEPLAQQTTKQLNQLSEELSADKEHKFKNAEALKKISGITLYSLGGPGVSKKTDSNATLMTYYHPQSALRVYNHNHELDVIPKFGEREFLSGQDGLPPRVAAHKTFTLKAPIVQKEIDHSFTLPFPGCNKQVMAAHNQRIFKLIEDGRSADVTHEVTNTCETLDLLNKKKFSMALHACYKFLFLVLRIIEAVAKISGSKKFTSVHSHQCVEVAEPEFKHINSQYAFKKENAYVDKFKEQLQTVQETHQQYQKEQDGNNDDNSPAVL